MEHRDYNIEIFSGVDELVEITKRQLGMNIPTEFLADRHIAKIMRFLGAQAPDSEWNNGEPEIGPLGIGMMLSVTLYCFPWYYERYELWQRN